MSLEKLPTEILCAILQEVAASGLSQLVGVTRANRGLNAISNFILYSTDALSSGGQRSMRHGLQTGLNNVVKLCLSAGVDPNLRIESRMDLNHFLASASESPSHLGDGRHARNPKISERPGNVTVKYNWIHRQVGDELFHSQRACYWTPLHVAATRDDAQLLSLLLDHGANPKSAGRAVCACYHLPLRRTFGRNTLPTEQTVRDFFERKLVTRWSPIHVAICEGNLDSAEQLISHISLAHATESDDSVLAEADQFVSEEPRLFGRANWTGGLDTFGTIGPLTPRLDPLSPLHIAAERYTSAEDLGRLYAMLSRTGFPEGPQSGVDNLDAFGDTPFAVAACSSQTRVLGPWFRDHGADINFALRESDGRRRSVLNALCKLRLYSEALSLMDLGVNINRDIEINSGHPHDSALHICCGYGLHRSLQPRDMSTQPRREPQKQREAIALIKRLIQSGADVNARAGDGITALMTAAYSDFPAAVRELLKANADTRPEDDNGDSALHHAVDRGLHLEPGPGLGAALLTMQLLLDNGADPNQCPEDSGPPLFRGQYGHDLMVTFIRGDSSIVFHRHHNMVHIAPLLINGGADPNIYLEDPRDLGEGSLVDQLENLQGRSLAVSAFYDGEFDSLDSLVASGTLVTRQDYLVMMRALIDRRVTSSGDKSEAVGALFRLLSCPSLRLQRPEDRKDIADAWTEMLYHAVGSRPKLVRLLAPHISLTNWCGPGGKTVLHLLAQWQRKKHEMQHEYAGRVSDVMTDLFRCGAGRQINQLDNSGRSPLNIAVDHGNIHVARELVQYGASFYIDHIRPDGATTISPLRSAIRSYSNGIQFRVALEMLQTSSSNYRSAHHLCGNAGLLTDLILHFGANSVDMTALRGGMTTALIQKLLHLGVDVNECDEHGNTALHHLLRLLLPSEEASGDLENSQDVKPTQLPSCPSSSFMSDGYPAKTDHGSFFELSEEHDVRMKGHNVTYDSDSDYEEPSEDDPSEDDPSEDEQLIPNDDGSDISDNSDSEEAPSRAEPSDLPNNEPPTPPHRCEAWIPVFFSLLGEDTKLTIRNNDGKTALDYIDEIRECEPQFVPKTYSRLVGALRESLKRPPFDPDLIAQLDESDVLAKGTPVLIVHVHVDLGMDEDLRPTEKVREAQGRHCEEEEDTCWMPMW